MVWESKYILWVSIGIAMVAILVASVVTFQQGSLLRTETFLAPSDEEPMDVDEDEVYGACETSEGPNGTCTEDVAKSVCLADPDEGNTFREDGECLGGDPMDTDDTDEALGACTVDGGGCTIETEEECGEISDEAGDWVEDGECPIEDPMDIEEEGACWIRINGQDGCDDDNVTEERCNEICEETGNSFTPPLTHPDILCSFVGGGVCPDFESEDVCEAAGGDLDNTTGTGGDEAAALQSCEDNADRDTGNACPSGCTTVKELDDNFDCTLDPQTSTYTCECNVLVSCEES